jgi:hypothetical protein
LTDVTATRAEVRARTLARAVPTWAWLAGIVVASAAIRFLLARRMVAPWIMVDELIYAELAKSFAAHGHLLIRDESATSSYGAVYPVLISPAYRIFSAVPDAYTAAKAINCAVMSLAAVPAYFLARRVLPTALALVAAALSVALPSLFYTGNLMTENAFYPIFLCVALALTRMLERPTRLNQLGVGALCLVAYGTRQQALALFPAVLTAPILVDPRRVGRFRTLFGTVGGVAALAVLVEAARGRTPLALLGAYESAGRHGYSVGVVLKWLLWHVAEVDLYVGVVPAVAFVVLALSWRGLDPSQRAYVAAAAALSAWLVVEVAAFASLPGVNRIEERDMFYVAPFFLIALLVWVDRGAPRPRVGTPLVAACCGALVAGLAFAHVFGVRPTGDTLALLPWWRLQAHGLTLHEMRFVLALAALAAAALFVVIPRRFTPVLPVLVLVYFAVVQHPIESELTATSRAALSQGIRSVPRDWIDRSVGKDADVAAVWTGRTDAHVIWENEFFNRSVGGVYDTGRAMPGALASTRVTVDGEGYLRDTEGRTIHHRYVLADGSLDLAGVKAAADDALGVNLWKVDGPLRSLTSVTGLYPGGTWSGPTVEYRRLHCAGGAVRVALLGDASLFARVQRVRAGDVTRLVVPGVPAAMTVPLSGCRARFAVDPTKVPGGGDERRLGVHFLSFQFLPPR